MTGKHDSVKYLSSLIYYMSFEWFIRIYLDNSSIHSASPVSNNHRGIFVLEYAESLKPPNT